MTESDPGLDTLLLLAGERFVVEAGFWVKFDVSKVSPSPEKPHGLSYSLTLHDPGGERILGFDNAHPVQEGSGPGARTRIEYDHRHKGEWVRWYDYKDAATLLADFWTEVESILKEGSAQR
jgi:hypothetical protein